MRKNLCDAIVTRLSERVPEVAHVDLWNRNVEFIEQEDGWARPAVFVELGTIVWSPFVGGRHRGRGTITLHVVTDWVEGGYDAAFELSERVRGALEGLEGEGFGPLAVATTATNHDHEELLESIDTFAVSYLSEL